MSSKEAWRWSRREWGEVDLGNERRQRRAMAVQSLDRAQLGGLALFMEPWLGEPLRAQLVRCELDTVDGALLMTRKAVHDLPWTQTDRK